MDEQKAAPQNEGPQNYTIRGGEIVGFFFEPGEKVTSIEFDPRLMSAREV